MAPPNRRGPQSRGPKQQKFSFKLLEKYFSKQYLLSLVFDPRQLYVTAPLFVLLEIFINYLIIQRVPYTEIDWKAYMQEVEGVVNGTFDYTQLKGDTGPLVYPAGFVYIFMGLYYITDFGTNIRLAQYIFAGLYIINLLLVFRIYGRSRKVPPFIMVFVCLTSYRVHSIFSLRLFNDPVAMLLLYASLNLFLDDMWTFGSIFFSLAVSVKMNILLFAPALLLAYIAILGFKKTVLQLFICGLIQALLAAPFLLTNPTGYILGAFNLGRIFLYKWTVNWRFITEELFVSRSFHLALLACHIVLLLYFAPTWHTYFKSYSRLSSLETQVKAQLKKKEKAMLNTSSSSQLFLAPLFAANFIGMVCARSLHYQFYIWYYHTLPYLLWCTPYSMWTRLAIMGIIEMCWNVYPSTDWSSGALHISHLILLLGLVQTQSVVCKTIHDAEPSSAANPTAAFAEPSVAAPDKKKKKQKNY
ncbi:lethal(2)neighbour of tid protein [Neocloeon triangulifer]|uniref:lethal(2)neighbour of tid protein n=1 Tax=Neocloeon triangulifer TaxID=2078957 RepID=UPI00286FA78B|nr:lethal(2)neighbour of tid protein [Neocloeon triangulifer]